MTKHYARPHRLRALRSVFGTAGSPQAQHGPKTARWRWDGGSGTQDQRLATADETTPADGIASPLHPLVLKCES